MTARSRRSAEPGSRPVASPRPCPPTAPPERSARRSTRPRTRSPAKSRNGSPARGLSRWRHELDAVPLPNLRNFREVLRQSSHLVVQLVEEFRAVRGRREYENARGIRRCALESVDCPARQIVEVADTGSNWFPV